MPNGCTRSAADLLYLCTDTAGCLLLVNCWGRQDPAWAVFPPEINPIHQWCLHYEVNGKDRKRAVEGPFTMKYNINQSCYLPGVLDFSCCTAVLPELLSAGTGCSEGSGSFFCVADFWLAPAGVAAAAGSLVRTGAVAAVAELAATFAVPLSVLRSGRVAAVVVLAFCTPEGSDVLTGGNCAFAAALIKIMVTVKNRHFI